jgi:hypothetical protein
MAERAWVVSAPAAFGAGPDRQRWGAKKRGHHVTLRPGWDEDLPAEQVAPGRLRCPLKVAEMQFLLRQKFYAIPSSAAGSWRPARNAARGQHLA